MELRGPDGWTEIVVSEPGVTVSLYDRLSARDGWTTMPPPDELVQAVERLGYEGDIVCVHVVARYDPETGVSNWDVVLATDTVLVEVTAAASRLCEATLHGEKEPCEWTMMVSHERRPLTYSVPPNVGESPTAQGSC